MKWPVPIYCSNTHHDSPSLERGLKIENKISTKTPLHRRRCRHHNCRRHRHHHNQQNNSTTTINRHFLNLSLSLAFKSDSQIHHLNHPNNATNYLHPQTNSRIPHPWKTCRAQPTILRRRRTPAGTSSSANTKWAASSAKEPSRRSTTAATSKPPKALQSKS